MANFLKKFFGSITEKPWEKERAAIDTAHAGKTFEISTQKSAVIIIFGIATVLFSLIFTCNFLNCASYQLIDFINSAVSGAFDHILNWPPSLFDCSKSVTW